MCYSDFFHKKTKRNLRFAFVRHNRQKQIIPCFDLLEYVEVQHHERNDGNDGRGQGRVADVAEGVPPDVGRVQPQFRHVVLDPGFVVVAHLKNGSKWSK